MNYIRGFIGVVCLIGMSITFLALCLGVNVISSTIASIALLTAGSYFFTFKE